MSKEMKHFMKLFSSSVIFFGKFITAHYLMKICDFSYPLSLFFSVGNAFENNICLEESDEKVS